MNSLPIPLSYFASNLNEIPSTIKIPKTHRLQSINDSFSIQLKISSDRCEPSDVRNQSRLGSGLTRIESKRSIGIDESCLWAKIKIERTHRPLCVCQREGAKAKAREGGTEAQRNPCPTGMRVPNDPSAPNKTCCRRSVTLSNTSRHRLITGITATGSIARLERN